jgi:hypothetical protein
MEGEELTIEEVAADEQQVAQAFIKVMLQPTSCGVMKFDDGRRMIVMTQGPFEISIPFGPGESEQLSQELHVSKIETVSPGEARASGLELPR